MDWFLYDRDLRHERVNTVTQALTYSLPFTGNFSFEFTGMLDTRRSDTLIIMR